jgi:hypothetical protein
MQSFIEMKNIGLTSNENMISFLKSHIITETFSVKKGFILTFPWFYNY